jgi:hypothetical protein
MGNSSSRSNSKSKASDRNAIRRRSFDAGGLSPGSSNHHRSRSMTPSFHMPEPHLAPPPPYSTEISKNPFLQPNDAPYPVGNFPHAGSQHTSFFVDRQATAGPSTGYGRAYGMHAIMGFANTAFIDFYLKIFEHQCGSRLTRMPWRL